MRKKRLINYALDIAILRLIQDDIPMQPDPYYRLADYYCIDEAEILDRIKRLKENGVIRDFKALLSHTRAGYNVNVLTAWTATPADGETEEEAFDRVGTLLSESPLVSHCYARRCPDFWNNPVFAMMHACSEEEMERELSRLQNSLPSESVRKMKTVKEWKKTSVKYF